MHFAISRGRGTFMGMVCYTDSMHAHGRAIGTAWQLMGALLAALFAGPGAYAQTASAGAVYPVKAVRVVIGGSLGSNADIFFRLVAQRMGSALGQPLVADYRPGAGGATGGNRSITAD